MSTTKPIATTRTSTNVIEFPISQSDFEFDPFQKTRQPEAVNYPTDIQPSFVPWRIFINQTDTYHGKKLAEFLASREYVNPESDARGALQKHEAPDTEDETQMEERETSEVDTTGKKYEVIGTTSDPECPSPKGVTTLIRNPNDREALLCELMKCGIIVYDVTQNPDQVDEARWALKAISRELESIEEEETEAFKKSDDIRYFVLISSVMTWAFTKPLDPDEPNLPFTEDNYRKRRPHPNYKDHCQLEKEVVIVKKNANLTKKLKTLVICCGITYGDEEGTLHYLFKMAWKNANFLPIIERGSNILPLLHVRDLVTIVFDGLHNWPPLRYMIAMEQELLSQRDIVKEISVALTSGKVKSISMEEAFLLPEMTQAIYDLMTLNIRMEPVYIIDRIQWYYNTQFRDNIQKIVKEYRLARNLHPIKIIVLGPPASGKTKIAQYLAKYYDIPYICAKCVIADTIQKLSNEIEAMTWVSEGKIQGQDGETDGGDGDSEQEDVAPTKEDLKEQLTEILKNMDKNYGRLDDVTLNKLFLDRLKSKDCRNQGYVIDGYPTTFSQAEGLFGAESLVEEEVTEEEAVVEPDIKSSIMPELVVALEASDEFLIERIITRPEREIQSTHYTEEHMLRRLKEYRERNNDDTSPLRFFDERENHPLTIPIEDDICPDMFPTILHCLEKLGKPRNYGLTLEEAKEAQRQAEEDAHAAATAERMERERDVAKRKRLREEKMMKWTNLMESLKEEEEARLCILGEPLRNYLVKYIFPTLTRGLIEVAKLRPDDPIDYLAEYLFKENPEGKMFEPDQTDVMNELLDRIGEFESEILPREELDDNTAALLKKQFKINGDGIIEDPLDCCTNRTATSPQTSTVTTFDDAERLFNEGDAEEET